MHHYLTMLLRLRSFLAVLDEGSLHRAAARLHLSQSALSRQMQALEEEIGGQLLDRSSTGVRPTTGGRALAAKARPILDDFDAVLLDVRRIVRGEGEQLRIGYLASAFQEYLDPALKVLRQAHPKTKVKLLDLFPGEQITALRRGEIDLALTQETGVLLGRDFYTRKLAVTKSIVALPLNHPLAARRQIRMADLKNESLIAAPDEEVPGNRRRLIQLCRTLGKFTPRLISPRESALAGALLMVANEDAIAILPSFMRHHKYPGIVLVPIADAQATWDLFVVWQGGQTGEPLRTLLNALPWPSAAKKTGGD